MTVKLSKFNQNLLKINTGTRAGRIVRVVRLVRLVRLYKHA